MERHNVFGVEAVSPKSGFTLYAILLVCDSGSIALRQESHSVRAMVVEADLMVRELKENDVIVKMDDVADVPTGDRRPQGEELSLNLPIRPSETIGILLPSGIVRQR